MTAKARTGRWVFRKKNRPGYKISSMNFAREFAFFQLSAPFDCRKSSIVAVFQLRKAESLAMSDKEWSGLMAAAQKGDPAGRGASRRGPRPAAGMRPTFPGRPSRSANAAPVPAACWYRWKSRQPMRSRWPAVARIPRCCRSGRWLRQGRERARLGASIPQGDSGRHNVCSPSLD